MNKVFLILLSTTHLILLGSARAEVGLDDRHGQRIQIQKFQFSDEQSKVQSLSQYFHSKAPVILALAYYRCPGVCSLVLNNLFTVIKNSQMIPGKAFEVIIVSIDPDENAKLAIEKKSSYMKTFSLESKSSGIHFLTGEKFQIAELSEELGFKFEKSINGTGFDHPSVAFILSANGIITQTIPDAKITVRGFHQAMAEASQGKTNSYLNQFLKRCLSIAPNRDWLNSLVNWLGLNH